ncbi:MAG: hypothetical protein C4563_06630 [Desulfobulbus sp.]|nr:MAG: hypothetical protein C4563_06630 [Desulfobulbus sp.]
MKPVSTLLVLFLLILSGCASSKMQIAARQSLPPADPGKSQVVFLRSSIVGSAIQSSVFDVTSGTPVFIGIVSHNTKVRYPTEPGLKTFMVVSEAADFMQAELAPGKTYYGIVTPRMGVWKYRFSLRPIKKDPAAEFSTTSEEFADWLAGTKLVEKTPEAEQWATENSVDVLDKYHQYWSKWQGKTETEKEQLTLRPEDGL